MAFNSVESELQSAEEENEARREQEELERMYALDEERQQARQRRNNPAEAAKNYAKDAAKKVVKSAAGKAVKRGAAQAVIATAPFWGPVVLAIMGIVLLLFLAIIIPVAVCNADGWDGTLIRWTITLAAKAGFTYDFCKPLAFDGGRSGGAGASSSFQQGDLDFVLTSAYRPGAVVDFDPSRLSAHGRGEAIDVALRNPSVAFHTEDARLDEVISLASNLGNVDVIDEYRNPSAGTQGPHIHIEFNAGACDGKTFKKGDLPQDLVTLSGVVPVGGGDPRVRPCMFEYAKDLFTAAGIIK